MVYQGPVRPNEDERLFRDTGQTAPEKGQSNLNNITDPNKPRPISNGGRFIKGGKKNKSSSNNQPTTQEAIQTIIPESTNTQAFIERKFGNPKASIGGKTAQDVLKDLTPTSKINRPNIQPINPTREQINKIRRLTEREYTTTQTIRNNKGEVVGTMTVTETRQLQFPKEEKKVPEFYQRKKVQIGNDDSYSFINKADNKITRRGSLYNRPSDIPIGFGVAVKDILKGTAQIGKESLKNPFIVTKLPKTVYTFTQEGLDDLGQVIRNKPYFATGYVAGSLTGGQALEKGIIKVTDLGRTIKLREVKSEDIIAPEYFKGQNYPQIKRGQTAQELLREFKPLFEGETKPAGFTASPNVLKGNKLGGGSSELQGLYQSPKLSPKFLKVTGEGDLEVPTQVFPTLRPTSFRITPQKIQLLKGVNPNQRNLYPLVQARESFSTNTRLGNSYVPFLKREKEAVIPANTLVKELPTRYYFKFEGRRIPIKEYETLTGAKIKNINTRSLIDETSSYNSKLGSSFKKKSFPSYKSSSSYSNIYSSLTSSYSNSPFSSSISLSSYSPLTSSSKSNKSSNKSSTSYLSSLTYFTTGGRSTGRTLTKFPTTPTTTRRDNSRNNKFEQDKLSTGYLTYIKRFGKINVLGGVRSRQSALSFGQQQATNSLARTFGIIPTQRLVREASNSFSLSNMFRAYRIILGKRKPLTNQFIQKSKYSLSSTGEKREIKSYKRRR